LSFRDATHEDDTSYILPGHDKFHGFSMNAAPRRRRVFIASERRYDFRAGCWAFHLKFAEGRTAGNEKRSLPADGVAKRCC
jgi:hypothetical protein